MSTNWLSTRRRWQATRASRWVRHRLRWAGRRPLARWRALPHFVIIGAQKSGTSSLYAHLASHPQVRGACWKEVHFFGTRFSKGTQWYRAHFPLKFQLRRAGAVTGEATPYYLYHPHAPRQMAATLPNVRLVALLRNPVDRAISHYWHQVKRGREARPPAEALAPGERREPAADSYRHRHFAYLDRGLYARQLARYDRHFDPEQLLMLKSEDFFQRPQRTFDRVTDFLDIDAWTLRQKKPRNTGSYPEASAATRARLERFFRPYNRALYERLGVEEAWW